MPVLSSFISYKPKRKTKQPIKVSSPFPITTGISPPHHLPLSSPQIHPYASPRIIDINDSGRLLPVAGIPTPTTAGLSSLTSPKSASESGPSPSFPSPYYRSTGMSTPRVQVNIEQEPLTDWFPSNFLKTPESISATLSAETKGASGSGTYFGAGYGLKTPSDSKNVEDKDKEGGAEDVASEEDEEDDVLNNLQLIGSSDYATHLGAAAAAVAEAQNQDANPNQQQARKPAPSPIRIPSYHNGYTRAPITHVGTSNSNNNNNNNNAGAAPKVHLVHSSSLSLSRPTSSISSPESSAVSGTTLARALLANTFVLSSSSSPYYPGHPSFGGNAGAGAGPRDAPFLPRHRGSSGSGLSGNDSVRNSRYRSGASNLTRTDSATLPKAEFTMLTSSSGGGVNSPPLPQPPPSAGQGVRDGRGSMMSSEMGLSPPGSGSASSPGSGGVDGVPPIPGNAELVYVPPQTTRSNTGAGGGDHTGVGTSAGSSGAFAMRISNLDKRKTASTLATVGSVKSYDPAEAGGGGAGAGGGAGTGTGIASKELATSADGEEEAEAEEGEGEGTSELGGTGEDVQFATVTATATATVGKMTATPTTATITITPSPAIATTTTITTRRVSRMAEARTTTHPPPTPQAQLAYMDIEVPEPQPELEAREDLGGTDTDTIESAAAPTEGAKRRPKTPPPETRPKEPLPLLPSSSSSLSQQQEHQPPRRSVTPELEVPSPLEPWSVRRGTKRSTLGFTSGLNDSPNNKRESSIAYKAPIPSPPPFIDGANVRLSTSLARGMNPHEENIRISGTGTGSNPNSNTNSVIIMSPPSSSSDGPSSGRDFDLLDYYSATETDTIPQQPPPPFAPSHPGPPGAREYNNASGFRLPFSPITEESSSQLSPPTPFRSGSVSPARSPMMGNGTPGRFFVGTTPGGSVTGVRVDWDVRNSGDNRSSRRSSVSNRTGVTAALPSTSDRERTGAQTPSNASSHSRTNLSISSTSSNTSLTPQDKDKDKDKPSSSSSAQSLQPPPPLQSNLNLFNRLRSGSAPTPIKVVRQTRDLSAYNITVTPRVEAGGGGSEDSTPTTAESGAENNAMVNIQQTFPETPSAFSPGFSPTSIMSVGGGMISPGTRVSGIMQDYLSMGVPQTPQSAFLPGISAGAAGIQPSLAQQVLLTRAATSVRGARHSRQASLGRMMRQQQLQQLQQQQQEGATVKHPYAQVGLTAEDEGEGTVAASSASIGIPSDGTAGGSNGSDKPPVAGGDGTTAKLPSVQVQSEETKPVVTLTRVNSDRDKPLPDKPAPSPLSTSAPSPIGPDAHSNHSSMPEPAAPVLASVSLPSLTPSPPTQTHLPPEPTEPPTPHSLAHGSEEAVLAYDHLEGHELDSDDRTPSRVANKKTNASIDDESSTRSRLPVLPPNARIPPAPTTTPPMPPMEPPPAPVYSAGAPPLLKRITGTPSASNSNASLNSVNSATPRANNNHLVDTPTPQALAIQPMHRQEPSHSPRASFRRPGMIHPPPSDIQIPPPENSASSLYSQYDAALSPPSYYAVINSDKAAAVEARTPSTSGSYDANYKFGGGSGPEPGAGPSTVAGVQNHQPYTPPPNAGEFVVGNSRGSLAPSTTANKRPRYRPPLPAGPRRPSQQHVPGHHHHTRDRGGSVSSIGSQLPSGRRVHPTPVTSPKFQTPTPKYRGFTMDAAKWTFTSTQLQAIVSRAIKSSSEASSIRLLKLETLDEEIPKEIERLETVKTDTIAKFKALARRRAALFDALTSGIDRLDPEGPAHALRLIEDLKDVTATHDRLAEELHSTDEQLAQLKQLCQSHSTSALAVALRKLNASFLKQYAESQNLHQQVETLERERDEAWKEAEAVAIDYEDLKTGKFESPPDTGDHRYNRVVAVRKSSVRATRQAALFSAGHSRSNHRASTGSNSKGLGTTTPSSARTTTYADDVPPIPQMPRRRPVDIKTNIPSRSSTMTGGSTDLLTPTSETRALVRAQEELYDMLGMTLNDSRTRRSHSVIGVPGEPEMAQPVISPRYMSYDPPPNTGRRASLPDSAALPPHPYNSLAADVSIILTSDDRGAGWF